jgi:hypothetical protein
MLLTNHTLTGVALGLAIDNPAVLAPTAVASHLVLDMTPHYGPAPGVKDGFREPWFLVLGSADFFVSIVVTVTAILVFPHRALHIGVGVFGAALPDLVYIPVILVGQARLEQLIPPYKGLLRFLKRIQWYERPPGLITEAVWALLMMILLAEIWSRTAVEAGITPVI